jgi:hypothetical protein
MRDGGRKRDSLRKFRERGEGAGYEVWKMEEGERGGGGG